jgi:methylmalonyl-CoA mutase
VRRALAIQLIINREWGLAKNENPYQGSFVVDDLTDWSKRPYSGVRPITARGGVLGAMETGYQRSKIQEESMYYEMLKHTGDAHRWRQHLPGSPCRRRRHDRRRVLHRPGRATTEEKESQLNRLKDFHSRNADQAPEALARLQKAGAFRRQHLCRIDGNGEMLQPGADHRRVV